MRNAAIGRFIRQLIPLLLFSGTVLGAWALTRGVTLEPADFTYNNGTEVTTLDPATVTGVPEGRIIRSLFEGLVIKDPKTLAPVPGVAESWDISDDGIIYTFHLREDAKWSNGDIIDSGDFLYSFERFLNPETAAEYAYQLWYVKGARAYSNDVANDGSPKHSFDTVGIRALDRFTLEIELASPTPFFMDLMGFYPLFPVCGEQIEKTKLDFPDTWRTEWLRPANIVTNGPYRVLFRRVNDRIRLVKNEHYWDADNVAFNTVDVLAIEQYSTMLNVYLTGGASYIDRVATHMVPDLIEREDFDPTPYLGCYFYRVNVTRAPMNDVRVREALSLTIDRRSICEDIMQAGQLPAYSLVPPGINGYDLGTCQKENIERAKELLKEAGYGPGAKSFPTIEIHYNTSEAHRDIAEVVADSWKRNLGIDCKLLNQEWKVYLDTQRNLNYDVSRAAWIGDYPDPNTFLDMFVTGGENNKTGWGDPEYDRLILDSAFEMDPVKRMTLLHEAETILMGDLPILPIYYYVTQNVVNPRLGGFFNNIQDEHFPKFWYWMDDAEMAERRAKIGDMGSLVDAHGPPEGQYSPQQQRQRKAEPQR